MKAKLLRIALGSLLCLGLGATAIQLAGCASTDTRKSTGQVIDDAVISTKVKAALAKDPVVSALEVGVDTFRGVVQLNGFVDREEQVRRAEQVARGVNGVVDVKNNLSLKPARR